MSGHYNAWLVALSVVVALAAAYVILDLAARLTAYRGRTLQWYWIVGGALPVGIGLWAVDFVGSLALTSRMPLASGLARTPWSLTLALLASGLLLYAVSREALLLGRLLAVILLAGVALASLRYFDVAAVATGTSTRFDPGLFVLGIVLAVTALLLARRCAFGLRDGAPHAVLSRRAGNAVILGAVLAGMHYSAQAAVHGAWVPVNALGPQSIGSTVLALAVSGFACALLAAAVLVSRFDASLVRLSAEHAEALAGLTRAFQQQSARLSVANVRLQEERQGRRRAEEALEQAQATAEARASNAGREGARPSPAATAARAEGARRDERKFYRVQVTAADPIAVTLRAGTGEPVRGAAVDISAGGIGARFAGSTAPRLSVGERVELALTSARIRAPIVVAAKTRSRSDADTFRRYGFEFEIAPGDPALPRALRRVFNRRAAYRVTPRMREPIFARLLVPGGKALLPPRTALAPSLEEESAPAEALTDGAELRCAPAPTDGLATEAPPELAAEPPHDAVDPHTLARIKNISVRGAAVLIEPDLDVALAAIDKLDIVFYLPGSVTPQRLRCAIHRREWEAHRVLYALEYDAERSPEFERQQDTIGEYVCGVSARSGRSPTASVCKGLLAAMADARKHAGFPPAFWHLSPK